MVETHKKNTVIIKLYSNNIKLVQVSFSFNCFFNDLPTIGFKINKLANLWCSKIAKPAECKCYVLIKND